MRKTRKQRARELLELVRRGPCGHSPKVRESYRLWSTTWILPELQRLIPELVDTPIEIVNSKPVPER